MELENSATQVGTQSTLTLTSLLGILLPDGSFTAWKIALDEDNFSGLSSVCAPIMASSNT